MTTAAHLRLNALCPYFTMFPLDFPARHLAYARPGEWVLDPFCGRGTTNFAARLRGLPTVGIDSSPVAVAIAQAKLVQVTPDELIAEAERILAGPEPADVPDGPFWSLAFHPRTLADLCRLREALLRDCESPTRVALRGLILGILHGPRTKRAPSYLSNQMPRTYATKPDPAVRFWTRRGMVPPAVDVLDVIARRARYSFATLPPPVQGRILLATAGSPTPSLPWTGATAGWSPRRPTSGCAPTSLTSGSGSGSWAANPPSATSTTGRCATCRASTSGTWPPSGATSPPAAGRGPGLSSASAAFPPHPALRPSAGAGGDPGHVGAPWRIVEVTGAGVPPRHRRQAVQFEQTRPAVEEIDLVAVLEE